MRKFEPLLCTIFRTGSAGPGLVSILVKDLLIFDQNRAGQKLITVRVWASPRPLQAAVTHPLTKHSALSRLGTCGRETNFINRCSARSLKRDQGSGYQIREVQTLCRNGPGPKVSLAGCVWKNPSLQEPTAERADIVGALREMAKLIPDSSAISRKMKKREPR